MDGSWRDRPEFADDERLALEYAERLTTTPATSDRVLVEQLSARFSPGQIVEMAAIIAWENYRARFNTGLGVEGHGFYSAGE
jgi:alkylhydroperoxidase family enzyme